MSCSFRRLAGEPAEEFRQRRAVADMRFARAFYFHRILAGFGQLAGIGQARDFRPRFVQPVEDRGGRGRRIGQHRLARQTVERVRKFAGRPQAHGIAQMFLQFGRALARIHEQIGRSVAMQNRERQRKRGMRHVRAADIEQPADRIRHGQHGGIAAMLARVFGNPHPLGFGVLARQRQAMRYRLGDRRFRLIAPHRIDRVAVACHQSRARFRRGRLQGFHRIGGV